MFSLLLLLAQAPAPEATKTAPFDHVLLISVDGLRSDALLVDDGAGLPHFHQLMHGPHTLNARCDPDYSVTLPNHTDMLTGRTVMGEGGHGWTSNARPKNGETLVDEQGAVIRGVYHRTSEAGIADALLASKPKFWLFPDTWNPEDGDRWMDVMLIEDDVEKQMQFAFAMLDPERRERTFTFLHLRGPDDAGHAEGWDMTPGSLYLESVKEADRQIGRLLHHIDSDPVLRARTAVVVTTDHGGGVPFKNHHGHGMMWVNTVIPLFVHYEGAPQVELYALLEGARRDPGLDPVARVEGQLPPIRNGDVGNLCMALLGLEPIEGSTLNVGQDLSRALGLQGPQ